MTNEIRLALAEAREVFPSLVLERARPEGSRGVLLIGERHVVGAREAEIGERLLDVLLSRTPHVALEGVAPSARQRVRWNERPGRALRLRGRLISRWLFGARATDLGPAGMVRLRARHDRELQIAYLEERGEILHLLPIAMLGHALLATLRVVAPVFLLVLPVLWVWTGAFPGRLLALIGCTGVPLIAWRILLGFDAENPGSRLVLALPRWLRFLLLVHDWDLLHERDRAMSSRLEALTEVATAPGLRLVIVGQAHLEGMRRELGKLGWAEVSAPG